jgi:hypothetical protein
MVAIQLLNVQHRREGFDCGDAALNEFLLRQAGQQQRRGFGKTYVAVAEDGVTVTGFVTVSAGQVATSALPAQSKLPRYPAPMLRIGRLEVDARHQARVSARICWLSPCAWQWNFPSGWGCMPWWWMPSTTRQRRFT